MRGRAQAVGCDFALDEAELVVAALRVYAVVQQSPATLRPLSVAEVARVNDLAAYVQARADRKRGYLDRRRQQ